LLTDAIPEYNLERVRPPLEGGSFQEETCGEFPVRETEKIGGAKVSKVSKG
jgi:hypothetical protein